MHVYFGRDENKKSCRGDERDLRGGGGEGSTWGLEASEVVTGKNKVVLM